MVGTAIELTRHTLTVLVKQFTIPKYASQPRKSKRAAFLARPNIYQSQYGTGNCVAGESNDGTLYKNFTYTKWIHSMQIMRSIFDYF